MGQLKKDNPDSFFLSMKPLLLFGQISGLFPLHGTTGSCCTDLHFSWYNWQFIYVGILFLASVFFNIISTKENLSNGLRLDNFGSTIFYSVCNLNTIFFIDLARQWPKLSEKVAAVENSMSEFGYPRFLALKIKCFLWIFIVLSSCEHSLLTYLNIRSAIEISEKERRSFIECFFEYRFPVIMENVVYNDFTAIFVFIVTVICTLNWNFLDFFLSCLSIQIWSKLQQFHSHLIRFAPLKGDSLDFWRKMWVNYKNISALTQEFERHISKLVFMSYVSNFYHLSLQLLRSFKFMGDTYSMMYFYFSMIYLMLRTLTVSLCGAGIHEESRKAKFVLFDLKKPCSDAERLMEQVLYDNICFTGKKFFYLDRRFILTMIGTIVTYEIILLQLNSLQNYTHL